jgi:ribosome-binding protein aMBF1 (putative translation factor)
MGRCESCGAEDVETQYIQVGYKGLNVCARCYSEIEKNKAEKDYYQRQR